MIHYLFIFFMFISCHMKASEIESVLEPQKKISLFMNLPDKGNHYKVQLKITDPTAHQTNIDVKFTRLGHKNNWALELTSSSYHIQREDTNQSHRLKITFQPDKNVYTFKRKQRLPLVKCISKTDPAIKSFDFQFEVKRNLNVSCHLSLPKIEEADISPDF